MSALSIAGGSGAGASVGGKESSAAVPETGDIHVAVFNESGVALGAPGCPAIDITVFNDLGPEVIQIAGIPIGGYGVAKTVQFPYPDTPPPDTTINVEGQGDPFCAPRSAPAIRVAPFTWHAHILP